MSICLYKISARINDPDVPIAVRWVAAWTMEEALGIVFFPGAVRPFSVEEITDNLLSPMDAWNSPP